MFVAVGFGDRPAVGADDNIGVKVPEGFQVNVYADDRLAHDIFCMTIDSQGRVVVSGAGYVRILIDRDGDGTADDFRQFADGPATGAQGMFFHGRDLFCVGDEGLLRYTDQDGDDRADGPPDLFLKCKTGSEHHVHSVQRGPDGWWYLIAGNYAEITSSYATLPTSPIKQPQAGTLLRLKPDLGGGEIVADGFRNAYDFAFNRQGDVFTFDSDGERDISLPWYRPTRVFHVLPGSNAGWYSRSWKRPDDYPDMPPVVASFGRGSPTGVVNYRHQQFPAEYDNALFALDWTYGRVLALPLKPAGTIWSSEPIAFMTAVGQFGFAPTDVEVGPDGSLFVSVGGRGTRGSVFRVSATQARPANDARDASATEPLQQCLTARQPLSSWSRARWQPLARELGRAPFLAAALDENHATNERLRAIEILTEMFSGIDAASLVTLKSSPIPEVRARAVWSYGRIHAPRLDTNILADFLGDPHPLVTRFTAEALLGADDQVDFAPLIPAMTQVLASESRFARQAAIRLVPKWNPDAFRRLSIAASEAGWRAGLSNAMGYVARKPGFNQYGLDIGLRVLEEETDASTEMKRDAIRLMQIALGDLGESGKLPPVYDSYTSTLDLVPHERELDTIRIRLSNLFPMGDAALDYELARLLAMVMPYNPSLLDKMLVRITPESSPVDDIHYLLVASRIPVERTAAQSVAIAQALVNLEPKIVARHLHQDTNWEARVGELYAQLAKVDLDLPATVLNQPEFGRPGHMMFLSEFTQDLLQPAIDAFVKAIQDDPEYPWTNDVVFVLAESTVPEHRELLRQQFSRFAVRNAVVVALSQKPEPADRMRFIEGLDSSQLEVLRACLTALEQLPAGQEPAEQVALVRTLRRLGTDKVEYPVREQIVQLLRRNTQQEFGYVLGKDGYRPQNEAVQKWTAWLETTYPQLTAQADSGAAAELTHLKDVLAKINWDTGDVARGEKLFAARSCKQCHGGRVALGPDLAGAASRFSRDDLFVAVALPNRDVSPRYQTTLIETTNGKVYTGLIVYESVDGLLLRNSTNQTFRIEQEDIEFRRILPTSLMPTGLLKDMQPNEMADLYAFIRSLGSPDADSAELKTTSADAGKNGSND